MAQRRSIASNAPTLPPARIWRRRRASMPRTRWRRPTTTPSLAPTAPCWRAQVVTRRVGLDHRYRGVECWGCGGWWWWCALIEGERRHGREEEGIAGEDGIRSPSRGVTDEDGGGSGREMQRGEPAKEKKSHDCSDLLIFFELAIPYF
jgi:hypothetical protein